MLGLVRCAAVSAVLSAGVVGVVHAPAKPYTDRLPASDEAPAAAAPAWIDPPLVVGGGGEGVGGGIRGDRLAVPAPGCEAAHWPYLPASCLVAAGASGAPARPVRMITLERRPAERVSVLERVPAPSVVAGRR